MSENKAVDKALIPKMTKFGKWAILILLAFILIWPLSAGLYWTVYRAYSALDTTRFPRLDQHIVRMPVLRITGVQDPRTPGRHLPKKQDRHGRIDLPHPQGPAVLKGSRTEPAFDHHYIGLNHFRSGYVEVTFEQAGKGQTEAPAANSQVKKPARKKESVTGVARTNATGPVYTIQAASVRDVKDADRLVQKLKKGGYPAYRAIGKIPGKGIWFRVRIGEYKRKSEAQSVMKKLEKDGLKPILVMK